LWPRSQGKGCQGVPKRQLGAGSLPCLAIAGRPRSSCTVSERRLPLDLHPCTGRRRHTSTPADPGKCVSQRTGRVELLSPAGPSGPMTRRQQAGRTSDWAARRVCRGGTGSYLVGGRRGPGRQTAPELALAGVTVATSASQPEAGPGAHPGGGRDCVDQAQDDGILGHGAGLRAEEPPDELRDRST
jgi:hypothetical protein